MDELREWYARMRFRDHRDAAFMLGLSRGGFRKMLYGERAISLPTHRLILLTMMGDAARWSLPGDRR